MKESGVEVLSLTDRFNKIQEKNRGYSTLVCFSLAITGREYSPRFVEQFFYELVDKKDWSGTPKKQVLAWLGVLNGPLDGK